MSAGLEPPPKCVFAHGWLLVGGEKMSKTALNQIAPADLVADFGVDGFRYHFIADQRFGPDGDFSLRGDGAALQRRPREQLRQPREPRAEHGGELLRRRRARHARRRPAASTRRAARSTALSDAMDRLDFATGFGAVWDLIRATNSYIEDREPWALNKAGDTAAVAARARRLPRGAAHRRAARVAGDPERGRRAVAPARSARPARGPAPPGGRGVGAAARRARRSRRARRCSRGTTPSDARGSTAR